MTIRYPTQTRDDMMNQITRLADAGAANAVIRIFDGARPEDLTAGTNVLAVLTMSDPSFGASSNGVITAGAIAEDRSTDRAGIATWFRIDDSDGNPVASGTIGLAGSGADMILNNTTIEANQEFRIETMSLTEGNA